MAWVPPTFWRKDNLWAKALTPASLMYERIQKTLFNSRTPYRSAIPVLCVGNVQLGGSGKTPLVQALCKLAFEHGIARNPVILLRGYGGEQKGPLLVDPARHTSHDVGDEALLHAQYTPTIIARNRASGAQLAEHNGHDLIIMDDGLQNNHLAKDACFLVFNTDQGLGNERTFPAGPLRETLDSVLEKIHAVFQIGDALPFTTSLPVYQTHINAPVAANPNDRYLAFCGIGQPEKFFTTLRNTHHTVIETVAFADHEPYTDAMLGELHTRAEKDGLKLITTEKDYMRLPTEWREKIDVLRIAYIIDHADQLAAQLKDIIRR